MTTKPEDISDAPELVAGAVLNAANGVPYDPERDAAEAVAKAEEAVAKAEEDAAKAEEERLQVTRDWLAGLSAEVPEAFVNDDDWRAKATQFLIRTGNPDNEGADSLGLLPAGRVAILTGAGGTGKSHLSLLLAIAVATGEEVGTFRPYAMAGARALVFCGEEDADEMIARLDAACRAVSWANSWTDDKGNATTSGAVHIQRLRERCRQNLLLVAGSGTDLRLTVADSSLGYGKDIPPADTQTARHLRTFLRSERAAGRPVSLLVLDTVSRFNGGQENDNGASALFMTTVESFCGKAGDKPTDATTVLLVHHSGKNEATNSRGASAFTDNSRAHFALVSGDYSDPLQAGLVFLTLEKANYSAPSKKAGGMPALGFKFLRPKKAVVHTLTPEGQGERKARLKAAAEAAEATKEGRATKAAERAAEKAADEEAKKAEKAAQDAQNAATSGKTGRKAKPPAGVPFASEGEDK